MNTQSPQERGRATIPATTRDGEKDSSGALPENEFERRVERKAKTILRFRPGVRRVVIRHYPRIS